MMEVVDCVLEVREDAWRDVGERSGKEVREPRRCRPPAWDVGKNCRDDEGQWRVGVLIRVAGPDPDHVPEQAKGHEWLRGGLVLEQNVDEDGLRG